MIEQFKDMEMRRSGVVYQSALEQIKKLYKVDPDKAGELAISVIEYVICGEISSTDPMIDIMIEPLKYSINDNKSKYDEKVEATRQKKIRDNKLDIIAEMMKQGMTQSRIGQTLGVSQQAISKKVAEIKREFPELLQPNQINTTENTTILQPYNCTTENTTKNNCTTVVQSCEVVSVVEDDKNNETEDWRTKFSF